jgi:hypothetical protein
MNRFPIFNVRSWEAGATVHSKALYAIIVPASCSNIDNPIGGNTNGVGRE